MTEKQTLIVALMCTVSLLIGWLTGNREQRIDRMVVVAEDWHRHVQQALFVARRTAPEQDETVPS